MNIREAFDSNRGPERDIQMLDYQRVWTAPPVPEILMVGSARGRVLRQVLPGATVETCLLQLAALMDPASPAVPAFEAAFRKVWDEAPS
jgi:hypothetical protein